MFLEANASRVDNICELLGEFRVLEIDSRLVVALRLVGGISRHLRRVS